MGDMADDLMDQMEMYCHEWCQGCAVCAEASQWVTREGQVLEIGTLKTSHLVNILNFVKRNRSANAVGRKRMDNLKREAIKRGCYRWMRVGRWMPPKT